MARGALIQYRRGAAAEWAAVNPVLAAGEVGYDSTTNEIRVGNGIAAWTALQPIGGSVSEDQIAAVVTEYLTEHPIPTVGDDDVALLILDEDTETHSAVRSLIPEGPAGDSAYQVALANGFVGTAAEWLASLQGEPGATTIDGVADLRKELDDRALTADVVGFVENVDNAIGSLGVEIGAKATQESVDALSAAQTTLAGNLEGTHATALEALQAASAASGAASAAQETASAAQSAATAAQTAAAAAVQPAQLASSPVLVRHGSNAATPRPDTTRPVIWLGSVRPAAATAIDVIFTSGSAPVFHGALDAFAAPFRAHSLRRTLASYTGPLVKVRRSSDNATLEIGATSAGDLDTAALLAFVGSGDGFVETFYDQGASGRHLSQATAANQPRIVLGGVLDKVGEKPALVFDGVSDFLLSPSAGLYAAAAATVAAVMKANANTSSNATLFAESRPSSNNGFWRAIRGNLANWNVQATADDAAVLWGTTANGSNLFDLSPHQALYIEGAGVINTWRDGVAAHVALSAPRGSVMTPVQTTLGAHSGSTPSNFFGGAVQEIVAWASAETASRTAIKDAQSTYWGTA